MEVGSSNFAANLTKVASGGWLPLLIAARVAGTAVFLHPTKRTTPLALRANVRFNQVQRYGCQIERYRIPQFRTMRLTRIATHPVRESDTRLKDKDVSASAVRECGSRSAARAGDTCPRVGTMRMSRIPTQHVGSCSFVRTRLTTRATTNVCARTSLLSRSSCCRSRLPSDGADQ